MDHTALDNSMHEMMADIAQERSFNNKHPDIDDSYSKLNSKKDTA